MHQKTANAITELENMIRFGEVGVSGFLPAERDLCRQLKIGRGALQTVLTELTDRDLVCRIPGKGVKILHRNDENKWKKFLVIIPGNSLNANESFEILRGVTAAADEQSAEIVLYFNHSDFIDRRLSERVADDNLDGIIFLEKIPSRICEAMTDYTVPYIVANYEGEKNVPAVRVDYRQVGRCAGRYLVGKGHRKIGFVGGTLDTFIYREMFAGLKGALAEDDLKPAPELSLEINSRSSLEERKNIIINMLKKRSGKCAIFAGRDHFAGLLFECCEQLGIRIPEDISIVSNDNVSWQDAAKYGLTTIAQPTFETGKSAINSLCATVKSESADTEFLMGELIERSSVTTV